MLLKAIALLLGKDRGANRARIRVTAFVGAVVVRRLVMLLSLLAGRDHDVSGEIATKCQPQTKVRTDLGYRWP